MSEPPGVHQALTRERRHRTVAVWVVIGGRIGVDHRRRANRRAAMWLSGGRDPHDRCQCRERGDAAARAPPCGGDAESHPWLLHWAGVDAKFASRTSTRKWALARNLTSG